MGVEFGGGISISSAASMLLSNSIIKGNTADEGGGIYLSHSNCTV